MRLQFVGDIMLDGGPGHIISNGGDPFANVGSVLLDADITIGNLECSIATEGHAEDKPYTFKGPSSALPLLNRYFTGVSIANNHSGDWGKAGFASEIKLLSLAHVSWFGGGNNFKQAHEPLLISRSGRRVAFLGYNEFPPRSFQATGTRPGTAWLIETDVINDMRRARSQHHADLVVLYLHWGKEFDEQPSLSQRTLAQRLIDAGADVIIGAHPHVVQTIEWYKGRPIVYSLGNFMFDYFPGDPPVWTGWMVRLTYGPAPTPKLDVFPVQLDAAGVPRFTPSRP